MLRVCSFYHLSDSDEPEWATFCRNIEVVNMMADIKPLSNGTRHDFLHGAILEQMGSLGCPTWRSDLVVGSNHLHVFILNTDAGGDISKCRRNIYAEVEPLLHVLVIGVNCPMHQYHLAVRAALNSLEYQTKHVFGKEPGYWRRLSTQHHYCSKLRLSPL